MKTTVEVFVYSIKIRGEKKNHNFSVGEDLFVKIKKEFINYIHNSQTGDKPDLQRTVRIPSISPDGTVYHGINDEMRVIYGIIESGLYGRHLQIVNKDNPEEILKQFDKNSAVIKPFFFMLNIPKGGDCGYFILQRTDNEGISPLFISILSAFLKQVFGEKNGFTIEKRGYISKPLVRSIKDGKVKSLTVCLKKIPKDLADRYMMTHLDEDTSLSITLNFKGGLGTNHKLRKSIIDDKTIFTAGTELSELADNGDIKIVTSSDQNGINRDRTIYLDDSNNSNVRPYYIWDVVESSNGYPTFESLYKSAIQFVKENKDLSKL